jgi:hypothetical protein
MVKARVSRQACALERQWQAVLAQVAVEITRMGLSVALRAHRRQNRRPRLHQLRPWPHRLIPLARRALMTLTLA